MDLRRLGSTETVWLVIRIELKPLPLTSCWMGLVTVSFARTQLEKRGAKDGMRISQEYHIEAHDSESVRFACASRAI
jgi:hypothetical protein